MVVTSYERLKYMKPSAVLHGFQHKRLENRNNAMKCVSLFWLRTRFQSPELLMSIKDWQAFYDRPLENTLRPNYWHKVLNKKMYFSFFYYEQCVKGVAKQEAWSQALKIKIYKYNIA